MGGILWKDALKKDGIIESKVLEEGFNQGHRRVGMFTPGVASVFLSCLDHPREGVGKVDRFSRSCRAPGQDHPRATSPDANFQHIPFDSLQLFPQRPQLEAAVLVHQGVLQDAIKGVDEVGIAQPGRVGGKGQEVLVEEFPVELVVLDDLGSQATEQVLFDDKLHSHQPSAPILQQPQ